MLSSLHLFLVLSVYGCYALQIHAPQCTAQWQSFGPERFLNASELVVAPKPPLPFENFNHGSTYEGLFVHSPSKFAFCLIEKNACSVWTALFNKLMTDDLSANVKAWGIAHRAFTSEGPQGAEQVFSDPTAVRAVMIRDPLARFASGFLDKCFSKGCSNDFCFMRPDKNSGNPISFKHAVKWMLEQDPRSLDGHFSLQSSHCELYRRVHEYTIVGLMNKSTLAADSHCILDRAGLARLDTLGDGTNLPYWHPSSATAWNEEAVLKRLFTKNAAKKLIKHFQRDYEIFNLNPEPAWVEEATGEWYDAKPDGCSRDFYERSSAPGGEYLAATPSHPPPPRGELDSALPRDDDVVELASDAGYFHLLPNVGYVGL